MDVKTTRKTDVTTIISYRDETYPVKVGGRTYYGTKNFQVSYARTAVEKFTERIVPIIKGGKYTKDCYPELKKVTTAAVWFGNSTLIFDRVSGKTRVSNPQTSYAELTPWGDAEYYEDLGRGQRIIGLDGDLYLFNTDTQEVFELDATYHSIFFRADDEHPSGQSRISKAARILIDLKSTNLLRREITADRGSFPATFINGLWEDVDPDIGKNAQTVITGTGKIGGLPVNPDTGEKLDIVQLNQVSPAPLMSHDLQIAKDFASMMNISPSELGVNEGNPPSAESLAATKESLVMEILAWGNEIKRSLTSYLVEVAEFWGEAVPVLSFDNPAVISPAAAMDVASKANAIWPQFRNSRAGAEAAGLSQATLVEMFDEDDVPFAITDVEATDEDQQA